jgi:hypothetical protein
MTKRRWLMALSVGLWLSTTATAQSIFWRAAGRPPAPPVAVREPEPPTPLVTLGRPVALTRPAPLQVTAVNATAGQTTPSVIRALSAESDPGQIFPPPPPSLPPSPPSSALPVSRLPDPLRGEDPLSHYQPPPTAPVQPKEPTSSIQWATKLSQPIPTGSGNTEEGITIPLLQEPQSDTPAYPVVPAGVGTAPPQPQSPFSPLTPHLVSGPPDSVPPPSTAPFPPPQITPGVVTDRPVAPGFFEKCYNMICLGDQNAPGRHAFQSDTCFRGLISPVTQPFFFEDPRALTEARPLFIYQGIPNKNPNFGGGYAYFFGSQFRLAFTERLSVVISELGLLSLQPKNPIFPVEKGSGFAEFKIGPKFTFLRSGATGSVAAVGLNFEMPIGSDKVFQNVGTLGLAPYITYGQQFGQLPGGYGAVNLIASLGYSASINSKRSEFLFSSLHLDYNIPLGSLAAIYPLVEFNWLHYTNAGTTSNLGTEGADLINFGSSTRAGRDFFSIAPGLRYKFNDNVQLGAAVEFPVSKEDGLANYRLVFDLILRY